MVTQIRLHHIRMFEFSVGSVLKQLPRGFIGQRTLWTLLTASLAAGGACFKQRESLGSLVAQCLLEAIRRGKGDPTT